MGQAKTDKTIIEGMGQTKADKTITKRMGQTMAIVCPIL
jgi:hypothetical protein